MNKIAIAALLLLAASIAVITTYDMQGSGDRFARWTD